jgi:hypothetical protein
MLIGFISGFLGTYNLILQKEKPLSKTRLLRIVIYIFYMIFVLAIAQGMWLIGKTIVISDTNRIISIIMAALAIFPGRKICQLTLGKSTR